MATTTIKPIYNGDLHVCEHCGSRAAAERDGWIHDRTGDIECAGTVITTHTIADLRPTGQKSWRATTS